MRLLLADHAGDEPGDGLDHDERRDLSAGEHVVPDRHLLRGESLGHPLVDALVPAAEERQVLLAGELANERLIETSTRRRQEQHTSPVGVEGLDRGEERLRLHHHPGSAAEGRVVDRAMTVARPLAKIVDADIQEPSSDRPPQETLAQG